MTTARWNEESLDPNNPEVVRTRVELLRTARRKPIDNRIDYLKTLVHGKRVLDVGVVAHFVDAADDERWLHGVIAKEAGYILGVDILEDAVAKLKDRGFNVKACDITTDPPAVNETFDIMLCGEVIEHLHNPGGMFAAASRLLVPGGRLIITTPNPYYVGRIYRYLKNNPSDSVDHVIFAYPGGVAEMASRFGMKLGQYRGIKVQRYQHFKGKLFHLTFSLIKSFGFVPDAECETMIYECVKQ